MNNPLCWRCGMSVESELVQGKVPFRAVCSKCLAALHSCFACAHYKKGVPNDCIIPDIEPIMIKDAPNFCEEFKPLFALRNKKTETSSIEQKLFGDSETPKRRDIKDLFSD